MSEVSKQDWYCIKFNVPKDKPITALEFSKKMNSFLEQINEFNHSIVNGIDDTYTVASYIEDFESGSVKWWLRDKLNKCDDKAIDKFVDSPIKTTIAGILKYSKKKAIEFLSIEDYKSLSLIEKKTQIIQPIIKEIESKKEELNINPSLFGIKDNIKIDENRLLKSLSVMSEIAKELDKNITFIDDYNNQKVEIVIPDDFHHIETTANTDKVLCNENIIEDIYILLTPTSKEDCKWELDDNGSKIKCVMQDKDFFHRYCNNEEKLGGNEQLKIKMQIKTFSIDGKIKKEHTILKIIEKIPMQDLVTWKTIQ